MKLESREDIKQLIIQLEKDFNVNDWKIDDFHLWPWIRNKLYFYLISKIEDTKKIKTLNTRKVEIQKALLKRIFNSINLRFNAIFNYIRCIKWMKNIAKDKTTENVFASIGIHWVNLEGKYFNKFIDSIISIEGNKDKSIVLQYGEEPKNNLEYHQQNYNVEKWIKHFVTFNLFFKNKKYISNFEGYQEFLNELKNKYDLENFSNFYNEKHWNNTYRNFDSIVIFFERLLENINPKSVYTFCFYHYHARAMVVAANRLGIETVEVQHGPMSPTDANLFYFYSTPDNGYLDIPKTFYCWDNLTVNVFKNDVQLTSIPNRKIVRYGQPWLRYWEDKMDKKKIEFDILYALQPNPVQLSDQFPPYIIDLLNKTDLKFYLRFHPLQSKVDIDEIKMLLSEKVNNNNFTYQNADADPLPKVIVSSRIVLTNYSGTVQEAVLVNKKFIVLHELGNTIFQELILSNKGAYFDGKNKDYKDFLNLFYKLIDENND